MKFRSRAKRFPTFRRLLPHAPRARRPRRMRPKPQDYRSSFCASPIRRNHHDNVIFVMTWTRTETSNFFFSRVSACRLSYSVLRIFEFGVSFAIAGLCYYCRVGVVDQQRDDRPRSPKAVTEKRCCRCRRLSPSALTPTLAAASALPCPLSPPAHPFMPLPRSR